jgi:hypothetical protein
MCVWGYKWFDCNRTEYAWSRNRNPKVILAISLSLCFLLLHDRHPQPSAIIPTEGWLHHATRWHRATRGTHGASTGATGSVPAPGTAWPHRPAILGGWDDPSHNLLVLLPSPWHVPRPWSWKHCSMPVYSAQGSAQARVKCGVVCEGHWGGLAWDKKPGKIVSSTLVLPL